MVRMGKIVISVIATTGYNDEILSSPDRRYKRFLLYLLIFKCCITGMKIVKLVCCRAVLNE